MPQQLALQQPLLNQKRLLYSETPNVCIGGLRCGIHNSYQATLSEPHYIERISVYAHDNIGDSTRADLLCYVDGVLVERVDVKAAGGLLTCNAYRTDK
ncbi:hypothetical protein J2Z48_000801 [Croceifilum oryzae]|uniref:Uncharacterized protein n=1 Tax=Croceifilum oryzae TaxID=1553429 RepID=A0AAJ1TDY4_9BACL|nr:hypothetical protein [Croceifilum oryzae]MDQ0416634.1 hypothetical protein [Croceifilum oryzae]